MRVAWLRRGVVFPTLAPDTARDWLSVVHDVARRGHGRVLGDMDEPRVDRSFYAVPVAFPAGTVTLLLNCAVRVVACVDGDRPFPANATFLDVPSPESFAEAGFEPASPDELTAPLTDADVDLLDEKEAEQVRYHRPNRVGDVLFNWFD